jgi:hypothetical protein
MTNLFKERGIFMRKEYIAIANTNENGLIKGEEYIIINNGNSTVDVYNQNMDYLMTTRKDNFDRWYELN